MTTHLLRRGLPIVVTLLLAGCHDERSAEMPEPLLPTEADGRHAIEAPEMIFSAGQPLDEGTLIAAVLRRNPSLTAREATERAARAHATQEGAFPEPTLDLGLAPRSLRESPVGYDVTLTEPIPWLQKLREQGTAALAAASAASDDVALMRLQLRAETMQAFAAYWQADAALAQVHSTTDAVTHIAQAQAHAYAGGTASRTQVLASRSMLNELDHHTILLDHARAVAIAHLNFLLHRAGDAPLPLPPRELPAVDQVPPLQPLLRVALLQRPDLAAASARLRQAQAEAGVVGAQDLPDLSLSVGYSTMWSDPAMRLSIGVGFPLPLNRDQRAAARTQAEADLVLAQAEQLALVDRIGFEVREAHERLTESWHVLHLIASRMIPTAVQAVQAADAALTAGGTDYVGALDARRQLIEMQWRNQMAYAECHERLADLERAVGGPVSDKPRLQEHTP